MKNEKIIHLEEAGTLKDFISRSEQNNIFSLKIIGFINKKDVDDVLEYMCSSEGDYDEDGEGDNWIADENIYIPDSVTEIGKICFRGSSNLKSIRLPQSIHRLVAQAISGCKNIKEIDIPANLKKFDFRTFDDCSLKRTVCLSEQPPLLMEANPHWKFLHDSKEVIVEVPFKSLQLYQKAEGWNQVKLVPIKD